MPLTENDILGYFSALSSGMKANNKDVSVAAAGALLQGFVIDVNRIANALETLATPGHAKHVTS